MANTLSSSVPETNLTTLFKNKDCVGQISKVLISPLEKSKRLVKMTEFDHAR